MELFEAVAKRHSYRGPFVARPVPRADLRRIVEAGIHAPSGYNRQSTSFVIVDDPQLVATIGRIAESKTMSGAPALIVVVMDPRASEDKGLSFGVEDYAAATENMLLAATALGYASVWIDGALRSRGRAEAIGRLLGVPADRIVRAVLPIGIPAETAAQKPKRPFDERAFFNRWGAPDPTQ